MPTFASSLANVLTVSALVAIFITLRRSNRTPRFHLWTLGWVVMWVHFALLLIPDGHPPFDNLLDSISTMSLGLSGLAFVLSVTKVVDNQPWRRVLLWGLGSLIGLYSLAVGYSFLERWPLLLIAAGIYLGSLTAFVYWYKRATSYVIAMAALMMVFGTLGLVRVWGADYMGGYYTMLLAEYGICAVLVLRAFKRWTAGVIVTFVGFVTWSMVWGAGAFFTDLVATLGPSNEIFNFPKLLVAFGMIMTELERRSFDATNAELRERQLGNQLARFAGVTTRLLAGAEVNAICDEIAQTITEIGNFRHAAIILADDAGRMYVGGVAGLDPSSIVQLRDTVSRMSIADIERTVSHAKPLGNNSVYSSGEIRLASAGSLSPTDSGKLYKWRSGSEVLVPLRSSAGNSLGVIALDEAKDTTRVVAEEMYAIEMLASHLGVAIEKASLQRKLVVREKLASIGQLVGGVAHELNNPLTVIIGYSDLLSESDTDKRYDRELTTMRREARRMRGIIDNLLRFARQSKTETQSANLGQAIEEALALRNYEIAKRGIEVVRDLAEQLPLVNIDESQLKTVIVNLLNNSFDAVQETDRKSVSIYSRRVADRVLFSVIDSGPGFSDVTRAFDPFFSTKGVGRGSGLGLSICYGIIKQNGGEIYAQNVQPTGACVTMELRLALESAADAGPTANAAVN